jgi:hypothetical protein
MFGIKFYTTIASALAISQIITSTWLCKKITDNHSNAKCVILMFLYYLYFIIIAFVNYFGTKCDMEFLWLFMQFLYGS